MNLETFFHSAPTFLSRRHPKLATGAFVMALMFAFGTCAVAQVPDLTAGGTPTSTKYWNMGPTGMKGWFYHAGANTAASRQILVTTVHAGSPAHGILAVGDVILGADGTGADPVNFSYDARKELADAIGEAEARDPAVLKFLRWRDGATTTVSITLEYLGAYSPTAPYNCPKSAAILEKGLNAVMNGGASDNYNLSLLTLLAGHDPANPKNAARQARAQQEAHQLILNQAQIEEYTSGKSLTASKVAWTVGFKLVAIAEYYLHTGDPAVYDSMRAYAIAYANGQSMFGTGGHQFARQGADGSINGPYGVGYGVVNSANMQCFYGLLLAREAGVNDPKIDAAIERATRFYGGYVDRGSIPYGEHQPGGGHESNGKMGIAALTFRLMDTHPAAAEYYTRMAGAAANARDGGHTGPYMNYLWSPLGANVGGEASMAAFFRESRWHYELARNWDGSFEYNSYGQGNNGGPAWSGNFQMSMAMLLSYATPLRQTYSTGKNQDPAQWFDSAEVDLVDFAATYNAPARTTNELLDDLGFWSPVVRNAAAKEIGTRTSEHAALLSVLHGMATDTNASVRSRQGACFALGAIAHDSSAPVLAGLLTDDENLVRWAAANMMRFLNRNVARQHVNTILAAAAAMRRPLLPLDEEDPIHLANAYLIGLLFHNGGAGDVGGPAGVLGRPEDNLNVIDRSLLYPAIRAAASHPLGGVRTTLKNIYPKLSKADLEAVGEAVVDSTMYEAPADRMFSGGVRTSGLTFLRTHNVSEGIPLAKKAFGEMGGNEAVILGQLQTYAASSLTVQPDPKIVGFCEYLIASGNSVAAAQAVLNAIAADQLPAKVTPLKGINWIFPDDAAFNLPKNKTVLRVDSYDHALGDSIYTWRKVHGAGGVQFTPNGTASAADTTVVFDGVPGEYLFEVTMSDSRGLTEVSKTVAVTLRDTDGTLPANNPPTANPQSITTGQGTPTQIILTGSDPEGHGLNFSVTGQPSHGTLSGTAPYLVYTSKPNYVGADSFTFNVMDSGGLVDTATVNITVDPLGNVGLAVYEPFQYPAGLLHGSSGANEVGLVGAWNANSQMKLVAQSLPFGSLSTKGGSVGDLNTGNSFGGARTLNAAALAGNGLLDDGATLWFSAVVGHTDSSWQRRLFLALGNNPFHPTVNNYSIVNDGALPGSGIGISLDIQEVYATQFRDASHGTTYQMNHIRGDWSDHQGKFLFDGGDKRLVVARITWGADADTIDVFLPYGDMRLPSEPSSTLTVNVDQSTYDTLTFSRQNNIVLDEIRFGATYQSVIQGTVAMTEDVTPPSPDPMSFAVEPYPAGPSSITMVATPAHDDMAVEYYFTNTAGGGNDSGWQTANTYTDTGLTPGVAYSYSVKARDQHPGHNETQESPAASATIPALATVPDVIGMPQASAGSLIAGSHLTVGSVTTATEYSLEVPAGHVLGQTPSGETTAAYGSAVDLVISIGQDPALPTLARADIVDDQGGSPVVINIPLVYTLTFGKDMDAATVDASDFINAGDAAITIGAITQTSPAVFTVEVTPTSPGILRFAVAAGAVLLDTDDNALNTTTAIIDDTVIKVNLPPVTVPNVVGMTQPTAESAIVAANLVVGAVYHIYHETVAVGNVISQNPSGGSSIPEQSIVELVVSLGPPPDTTGPVIVSHLPADQAIHVEVDSKLEVYFDEEILPANGNIIIRNLDDYTQTNIPINDASQVAISGVVLTITPAENLLPGRTYAVRISYGAVEDESGNPFSGINDNETWNFSTAFASNETVLFSENFESPVVAGYAAGSTPPGWVRANVGGGSTGHGLSNKASGDFNAADPNHQAYAFRTNNTGITTDAGMVATIAEGVTYRVEFDVIRDASKAAHIVGVDYNVRMVAYDVADARNNIQNDSPGILLASKTGKATENGSFSRVTLEYTVPAGSPAIGKDLAVRFRGANASGIIDNVVVKTVVPNLPDVFPPVVTRFTPEDGATSVPVIDNLVMRFNENIVRGNGFITLRNLSDGTEIKIDMLSTTEVFISGPELTINPADDMRVDTFYAVRIPPTAVYDLNGNNFEGIGSDKVWRFFTGAPNDSDGPVLVSLNPENGATDVPYGSDLVMTFDESVVPGSGSITLRNLTAGTQIDIDVNDPSQVLFQGPVVTVSPAIYLAEGETYAIRVDAGAILDLPGNPFEGIDDDATWNFTVSDANPPTVLSFHPGDQSFDVDYAADLTVVFDKDVVAGTGNITLKNLADATQTVIDIADGSQISISGPVLTITPAIPLAPGSLHAVLIDAGAVTDLQSLAFAGIASEAVWTFTTVASLEGLVFFDDFEAASGSPDVNAFQSIGDTSGQTGPGWVRSNQGGGAERHGIVDESSGLFADPTGEQAYAFRASNTTGITTVHGVIGTLAAGKTYTVSFHVARDDWNAGNSYNVSLLTFAPGADRTDARNTNFASRVLQTVSGSYSGANYRLITFQYTSDGVTDGAVQGHDVAVRLKGALASANIDNVRVTVTGGSEDDIPPTLSPGDIVDNLNGQPAGVGLPVTYTVTFSEAMNPATVTGADFGNAGSAAITIGAITQISPAAFSLSVTPTTTGSLQLRVNAGAILTDLAGNLLDTLSAIADDTIITVMEITTVPHVVGLAQAAAESGIAAANLVVGAVTEAYHPTVPAGDVISQNPVTGTTVAEGSAVGIVVSLGPLEMTATFDANGGTAADPADKQVIQGAAYGTLATTNRSGYTFTGWFTAAEGGDLVESDTVVTAAENHTLYAQWNLIPVGITLGGLSQTYDGSPKPVGVTTDPDGMAYSVTYNGSATVPTDAGSYAVVVTITEPNQIGSASDTLVISQAAQTINFAALNPVSDVSDPFELTATATSGLPVSYVSSDPSVATVSGNTVTVVALGTTTITASQAGNANYLPADDVPQTLVVVRENPLADAGGPYKVFINGSLALDGGASFPSDGETISSYEWDLDNNGTFDDATGATPTAISLDDLIHVWGMTEGTNTVQLRVTDTAAKTSTAPATVELVLSLQWDANGAGTGQTNGGGAWLGNNLWWDGSANVNWVPGSNAIFGGPATAGGSVTLASPTSVNSLVFNAFTGTYTLGTSGQMLTLNDGINKTEASAIVSIISPLTLGADQLWTNNSTGALSAPSGTNFVTNGGFQLTVDGTGTTNLGNPANSNVAISGSGDLVKNGTGRLNVGGVNSDFTGTVTINGGVMHVTNNAGALGVGNVKLNGGVLSFYWSTAYTRALGTGDNQIQIPGGESGFAGSGTTGPTINFGGLVQWGSTHFNPSKFVLGDSGTNNAANTSFSNAIDLNGATRTVLVPAGLSAGINRSTISGVISNSTGTGNLIKEGGGYLTLTQAPTYNGTTTVSEGRLDFGGINLNSMGGGAGVRSILVESGAVVRRNNLDNAFLQRLVETTHEIGVMTGASGNNLDFSSSTGANLPNAFLGNWADNGAKAEISGTITPGSDGYKFGAFGSNGLLGIRGALTGDNTLTVGQTGSTNNRVNIVAANTHTGETVINTGSKLVLGNNLALQNSALNVGASGGSFALAAGTNSGRITGETEASSPTFGGLRGSRNLLSVFTSAGGNNETNLAATAVTGFTLNPGSGGLYEYSGAIADFAAGTTLAKTGAGTQILAGANTYTGATSIQEGKLIITGSLGNVNATLSVASGATLGGTGTVGRNVTIESGGKLEFDISTPAAAHNPLDISAGRSFDFAGTSELTITTSGGAATGTYTLITGGDNLSGSAPATLNLPDGWAATTEIIGNSLLLHVTSVDGGVPGSLAVAGSDGLAASGPVGGPFAPDFVEYTLSNPGDFPIDWSAEKTAAWLDLDPASGTLAAGAETTVTVSINNIAQALGADDYDDTVTFTNTTNGDGSTTRSVSLTIASSPPIPVEITIGDLLQTYDGSPKPIAVTTTPDVAYSVTYDGSTTPPTDAGSYSVVVNITEPNHEGGATDTLVITKAEQTITFAPIDSVGVDDDPFPLGATATSGLPVSFASSNPAVATVSGNVVTPVAVGFTTITASQTGNANFEPAPDSTRILTVLASGQVAIGGEVTFVDGYYIHTFTEDGNFEVLGDNPINIEVLVVGGGGGGGSSTAFGTAGAGGGGAGGLVYEEAVPVTGTVAVAVGNSGAGAGAGNTPGSNGGNSGFGSLVALGGGGGAGGNMQGLAGGSGGGSRGDANGGSGEQPASTSSGFGNPGGGWPSAAGDGAGGGGGAGEAAPSSPPHDPKVGGPGGNGLAFDISGTLATYAGGGGGGGAGTSDFGSGGLGGGGNGANNGTPATAGVPNTGGGGGGGNNNLVGADGGSGVVIVRYPAIAPAIFAVTFDSNGGTTPDPTDKEITLDATYGTLATTTRIGYTFNGWFTAAEGGTEVTESTTVSIAGDHTLYAQWTLIPVAVVTDTDTVNVPEGGTETFQVKLSNQPAENVTVTVSRASGDTDITVQSGDSLTFTSANWDNWQTITLAAAVDSDAENGVATITCEPGNPAYTSAQVTAIEIDKDTTLTVASGGNGTTDPSGTVIVEKDTATAISATPDEGYDFVNWTVTSGSADLGDAGAATTTATLGEPATVQANFAIKTYTVTYLGNENTSGTVPDNQTKIHGVDLTLASNTGNLTKTGFNFAGWNTAADGSGTDFAEDAAFTIDADITLYAKWNSLPAVDAGSDQTILLTGAASWTPAEITTTAWYDATDGEMVIATGGAVSSWMDKSGNNRNATQTNAALRPMTGIKTIGGKNIIDFNAANTQSLNIPALDVIGREVWGVFLIDDYTTSASQLLLGGGGNVQIGVNSSTEKLRLWAASNPYSADTVSNATVPVATPTFAGWLAHTDTKKFSINGTLETTTNTYVSPRTLSPTFIGRGQFAHMDGAIGEIVITDAALSLEDRQKMEGYLAHKWGLAGNLPTEHPYEMAEPGSPTTVAQLDGSASDPEEDPLTILWTLTEGPAAVVFADPSDPQTTATFTTPGTYTLRLTASDHLGSSYDECVVTVIEAVTKPVASFAITGVPSQVTFGATLDHITITALDEDAEVATSFTGTVTFGGTAGVTGTSANFTDGVLTGLSITPANIGSDLTLTVDDGAGHTGTVTFTVQSLFAAWADQNGLSGADAAPDANPDGDSLTNLQEFAFGTNPSVAGSGPIVFEAGGAVITPGTPVAMNMAEGHGVDFRAVFGRRKNHQAAGLIYTVEFSANLADWVVSAQVPIMLTGAENDSDVEAVSVPYPMMIPTPNGFEKPTFFRVGVTSN